MIPRQKNNQEWSNVSFNPKKAEGAKFDPTCGFFKNATSKERVKPCFL